jgi:eukaryotic-like serine/threonine-protein kinase
MTCAPGTRFGPYEVTSILGTGGMGEVYRARDARLDRDVALKVLPSALTVDAERLLRFKREALFVNQWSRDGRLALQVAAPPKSAVMTLKLEGGTPPRASASPVMIAAGIPGLRRARTDRSRDSD